ncbi:MAG TPA: SDR family oxidoreductase [Candidatus Binataceae bacterium]|nr:SDR family oxidoreductase [Candidatus Binataceae bacterium]
MDLGLGGKVVIVTGGSKGIGRAVALSFLNEGASVLVCARGQDALDETIAMAGANAAARIAAAAADLTRGDAIEAVVERCRAVFGGVDILVNNAGSTRPGEFLKLSDEAWMEDWSLKFFGYVRMAREVLPLMQKRGGGVIVNVIGTGALRPAAGFMIGGAVNAALNHFTKALADEGAKHGVRVVGVNPGPIMTERLLRFLPPGEERDKAMRRSTPLGRAGQPEEVADLVAFLASGRAAFIHGANVTIDGGANTGLMG